MKREQRPGPGKIAQRSCVACRQTRAKGELLRIVRTPHGEVCLDPTGKLAGRGAYLCRDLACLEQAVRQGKLNRALARPIGPELVVVLKQGVAGSATAAQSGEKQAADAGA